MVVAREPEEYQVQRRDHGEGRKEQIIQVDKNREVIESDSKDTKISMLKTHVPLPPIQVFPPIITSSSTYQSHQLPYSQHPPPQSPSAMTSEGLNSRGQTNPFFLFLFLFHLLIAAFAVSFFSFKAIQGITGKIGLFRKRSERHHLIYWLSPVEGSVVLAIVLAFIWRKTIRVWPFVMVRFILWFSFGSTMVAGILLLCFSRPATFGLGFVFVFFSIGSGLYACWVTPRTKFASKIIDSSLHPISRFPDLNHPTYVMLFLGFVWISIWSFAVIGALNFPYPALTILGLVLSLMWTAEVIRNVANLTVSRVIALYYLRGMQSNTKFCFMRAVTKNLGSACLGSLFVPTIEASRIIARGLNLLEGEDEFMFSCAHCCLRVMEAVFRYGNSWAFVHIAAYGRGFVAASQSTWGMFQKAELEPLVDSDMTSSICFLSGISSGSICVIFASSWTFSTEKNYTATVTLLSFLVGYLLTRIGMALPQACIGCYYVCYAENPNPRLFDSTIPERISDIKTGRALVAPTPRFPRRFAPRS